MFTVKRLSVILIITLLCGVTGAKDASARTAWCDRTKSITKRSCSVVPPWSAADTNGDGYILAIPQDIDNDGINEPADDPPKQNYESTYFDPKIRVQISYKYTRIGKTRTDNLDLSANECKFFKRGGLPKRFCARYAVPKVALYPGDIGYNPDYPPGTSLNSAQIPDPNNPNEAGINHGNATGLTDSPRAQLCAYEDPCDITDPPGFAGCFTGGGSPWHHNTPKEKVKFFLAGLQGGVDYVKGVFAGYNPKNYKGVRGEDGRVNKPSEVLDIIMTTPIMAPYKAFLGFISAQVKKYNLKVHKTIGCVDIPVGPMPPGFSHLFWNIGGVYHPPPTLEIAPDATFFEPHIRVKMCEINDPLSINGSADKAVCDESQMLNGVLDPGEDTNGNGVLDPGEDRGRIREILFHPTDGNYDPGGNDFFELTPDFSNLYGFFPPFPISNPIDACNTVDDKLYCAKVSVDNSDKVCLYRQLYNASTSTTTSAEIPVGCVDRPGYTPMPVMMRQEVAGVEVGLGPESDATNATPNAWQQAFLYTPTGATSSAPDGGEVTGTETEIVDWGGRCVENNGLPKTSGMDDIDGASGATYADCASNCKVLHQVEFCLYEPCSEYEVDSLNGYVTCRIKSNQTCLDGYHAAEVTLQENSSDYSENPLTAQPNNEIISPDVQPFSASGGLSRWVYSTPHCWQRNASTLHCTNAEMTCSTWPCNDRTTPAPAPPTAVSPPVPSHSYEGFGNAGRCCSQDSCPGETPPFTDSDGNCLQYVVNQPLPMDDPFHYNSENTFTDEALCLEQDSFEIRPVKGEEYGLCVTRPFDAQPHEFTTNNDQFPGYGCDLDAEFTVSADTTLIGNDFDDTVLSHDDIARTIKGRSSEDLNGNGLLDGGEDANGNGVLDPEIAGVCGAMARVPWEDDADPNDDGDPFELVDRLDQLSNPLYNPSSDYSKYDQLMVDFDLGIIGIASSPLAPTSYIPSYYKWKRDYRPTQGHIKAFVTGNESDLPTLNGNPTTWDIHRLFFIDPADFHIYDPAAENCGEVLIQLWGGGGAAVTHREAVETHNYTMAGAGGGYVEAEIDVSALPDDVLFVFYIGEGGKKADIDGGISTVSIVDSDGDTLPGYHNFLTAGGGEGPCESDSSRDSGNDYGTDLYNIESKALVQEDACNDWGRLYGRAEGGEGSTTLGAGTVVTAKGGYGEPTWNMHPSYIFPYERTDSGGSYLPGIDGGTNGDPISSSDFNPDDDLTQTMGAVPGNGRNEGAYALEGAPGGWSGVVDDIFLIPNVGPGTWTRSTYIISDRRCISSDNGACREGGGPLNNRGMGERCGHGASCVNAFQWFGEVGGGESAANIGRSNARQLLGAAVPGHSTPPRVIKNNLTGTDSTYVIPYSYCRSEGLANFQKGCGHSSEIEHVAGNTYKSVWNGLPAPAGVYGSGGCVFDSLAFKGWRHGQDDDSANYMRDFNYPNLPSGPATPGKIPAIPDLWEQEERFEPHANPLDEPEAAADTLFNYAASASCGANGLGRATCLEFNSAAGGITNLAGNVRGSTGIIDPNLDPPAEYTGPDYYRKCPVRNHVYMYTVAAPANEDENNSSKRRYWYCQELPETFHAEHALPNDCEEIVDDPIDSQLSASNIFRACTDNGTGSFTYDTDETTGPGGDGIWGTGDDVISSSTYMITCPYSPAGHINQNDGDITDNVEYRFKYPRLPRCDDGTWVF